MMVTERVTGGEKLPKVKRLTQNLFKRESVMLFDSRTAYLSFLTFLPVNWSWRIGREPTKGSC